MKFEHPLIEGTLIKRYKRFLADVRLPDGKVMTAHCPNTGSMTGCAEPGSPVYLSIHDSNTRKYVHTLEIVDLGSTLVGVNTALPNALVAEAISSGEIAELKGYEELRREVKVGNSRLDLLLENPLPDNQTERCYIEVKNVTLADQGVAYFPDAVSSRGVKHLKALERLKSEGHRTVMFYVVQRGDCKVFKPADSVDPLYGEALRAAYQKGVEILVYQAEVRPQEIFLSHSLSFEL